MLKEIDVLLRLLISAALAGFIGLERESHKRPAGLRTHILVSVGSTLIMLTSIGVAESLGISADPTRIAANVVSGIGFLGAGTIMREGANVKGLTTAASLWVVSGIGLAVGSGLFFTASVVTVIVVISLVLLDKIELRFLSSKDRRMRITAVDRPGILGDIGTILGKYAVNIEDVDLKAITGGMITMEFGIKLTKEVNIPTIFESLRSVHGIVEASCGKFNMQSEPGSDSV